VVGNWWPPVGAVGSVVGSRGPSVGDAGDAAGDVGDASATGGSAADGPAGRDQSGLDRGGVTGLSADRPAPIRDGGGRSHSGEPAAPSVGRSGGGPHCDMNAVASSTPAPACSCLRGVPRTGGSTVSQPPADARPPWFQSSGRPCGAGRSHGSTRRPPPASSPPAGGTAPGPKTRSPEPVFGTDEEPGERSGAEPCPEPVEEPAPAAGERGDPDPGPAAGRAPGAPGAEPGERSGPDPCPAGGAAPGPPTGPGDEPGVERREGSAVGAASREDPGMDSGERSGTAPGAGAGDEPGTRSDEPDAASGDAHAPGAGRRGEPGGAGEDEVPREESGDGSGGRGGEPAGDAAEPARDPGDAAGDPGEAGGGAAVGSAHASGIRSGRSGTSGAAGSGRRFHSSAARRVAEPDACSGWSGSPTCRVHAANAPAARGGSVAPPPTDGRPPTDEG